MPVTVLLADDKPLVRELRPHVIAMDIHMHLLDGPLLDGIEATPRHPRLPLGEHRPVERGPRPACCPAPRRAGRARPATGGHRRGRIRARLAAMRAVRRANAGPALAAAPSYEYDPAIMRTRWEDGRWGS
ncbi:hypothetical protein [Streptomyces sp. NRRL S-920]|uniref:hypothetical protein n=1 Tax=Streptomyces sp. NRRL S-920 TaxID=1463921 RepID=UPI0004C47EF7|nr:hypothetical protein [Streptomyces sp. NRRL S-920]